MRPNSTFLRSTTLWLALAATGSGAHAQLTTTPQSNVEALAAAITGSGVRIANPVIDCHAQGFGEFAYSGSVLGPSAGVLLTSGRITNAVGPNNAANRTFEQGTPGNALLNTVTGRTTFDACRLEFDIIPGGDTLRFNFAFASEEYNEWVGSQFNDVFGFFISGPGIAGDPGIGAERNIALVPNTTQAVTINNVNNGSNAAYYLDNTGGQHIQYDGITRGLQAVAAVQPCQTYRLKLIVADASDRKFDSGVFIERIQSNAVTMQVITATGYPHLVEGCHGATLRFTRQRSGPAPLSVPYFLGGTAVNGSDYGLIGSADPAAVKIATIPGGATSVDVPLDPIADGIAEGTETLRILLATSVCPGFYVDSLEVNILDVLPVTVTPGSNICPGNSVNLAASGALTYTWSPSAGLNTTAGATTTATPASTTTYTVSGQVGACMATASTPITVNQMTLSAVTVRPLCSGQQNGALNLTVSGGNAPFSYAWTGTNNFSASTEDLVGIGNGTYTVTVTDALGCQRVQSFNVTTPQALALSTTPSILPFGQNVSCFGGTDGSIALNITGGTGPFQITWNGPNGYTASTATITGLAAGSYTVTVTDANGCTATAERNLVQANALVATLAQVVPATCANATDGSLTATIAGGIPPYAFQWSSVPAQASATATGLAPGNYTCTITDGYGCTSSISAVVPAPQPLQITFTSVSNVFQCQGQQNPNGSATAVVTGGTAPYSFAWNTIPAQNSAQANFNTGGTYTVTVTDANNCSGTAEVSVMQPGQSNIAVTSQTNVGCGSLTSGSATVAVTGGSNVQSIVWNTLPPQSGSTASGLSAGTYTATAQHADGCQSIAVVTITGPSAALQAGFEAVQGVDCHGASNGSATAVATGGVAPYSFQWNSNAALNTAMASGLAGGNNTVVVTDAIGCTATATVTIPGPLAPLQASITGFTNVLCFETAQGTAQALATGGTPPYVYTWNTAPTQTGPSAEDLEEGSYTVSVVDANGCTAATSVNIGGPQFGVEGIIETFTNVSCFGGADGGATLTVTGGSGSYTITWLVEPPQTGNSVTGLAAGDYMVSILDNNGCDTEKFINFTILGPQAPLTLDALVSNYNGFQVSCSDGADGSIDITATGGYTPYSYLWSDLQGGVSGSEDLTGLGTGTYQITVTDANGCTVDSLLVLNAPPPLTLNASVTTTACQGSSTGAIDLTIDGGHGAYSVSWTGPNGFLAQNEDIDQLAAGIYTVTVTDANGCTQSATYDVSEPGVFTVNAVLSNYAGGWGVSCAGATNGSIDLSVSGGTGNYTYAWTGPGITSPNTQDQNGLGQGVYAVTITDENGCSAFASYTLVAPGALNIALQPGTYGTFNTSCAGATDGNITATITGGTVLYDIQWNGPDGYTASTQNIFGLAPGTYVLSVTDANGCASSASATLSAPAPVNVAWTNSMAASGDAIACAGAATGSIDLTITGGAAPYSTTWAGPNGFVSNSADISTLTAGTYAVTVTDANGCTQVIPITLTEPSAIDVSITTSNYLGAGVTCSGAADGSLAASASGGSGSLSFAWSGPDGFSSADANISGLAAGVYQLTVTDGNGCTVQRIAELTSPSPIAASITLSDHQGSPITCAGANDATLSVSILGGQAPYQSEWVGPDGFQSNDTDLIGLAPGSYQLSVTDANGCLYFQNVIIAEPSPLAASYLTSSFAGGLAISCAGATDGAVDLTVQGGTAPYTYQWTDGLGFLASQEDIQDLAAGVYQYTVTDANGCSISEWVTLAAPAPLGISATLSGVPGANVSCANATDGSISLVLTGGVEPYNTLWSNGATGPMVSGLAAGSYSVTLTDANGCVLISTYTLDAPEVLDAAIAVNTNAEGFAVDCADGSTGSASAIVSGGTAPYTLAWSGPNGFSATDPAIGGLAPGTYTLTVTDALGCQHDQQVVLNAPPPITSNISTTSFNGNVQVSCFGASNASVNAVAAGGQAPLQFSWSGPNGFSASGPFQQGLSAGTYTLTVQDSYGCTRTTDVILAEPDAIDVSMVLSDVGGGFQVGCAGNDGEITAVATGGTAPYTFQWTGPQGFGSTEQSIEGAAAGTYHLTVIDANGCVFENNATLQQPPAISVAYSSTPSTCPGEATGTLQATPTGGVAPYTYVWSGPGGVSGNDAELTNIASGNYTLAVIDALGCTRVESVELSGPAPLAAGAYVSFYGTYNLQCAGDSSGVIGLAPVGGTAPYQISVNGPGGPWTGVTNLTGLVAGAYQVNVTDANGCSMDTTITLTGPEQSINADIAVSIYASGHNVSCHGGNDGWISATVTGGAGNYSFNWRGPDSLEWNTPTITGLTAGNYAYELVVVDGNQCSFFTEVVLQEPDAPLSTQVTTSSFAGGYQVSCPGSSDGSIDLAIQGGSPDYTVAWQGPDGFSSTSTTLSALPAGSYLASITDLNGCVLTTEVILEAAPVITIGTTTSAYPSGHAISCANAADGSINAVVEGGAGLVNIAWTGPAGPITGGTTLEALSQGTYCITATDANGCTQEACMTLNAPEALMVDLATTIAACGADNGAVTPTVTGGAAPYAFNWSNGSAATSLTGLGAGSYQLTVSDLNGCTAVASATVVATPALTASASVSDNLCHGGNEGAIDLTLTSGTAPFTFSWSNGAETEDLNGLAAGNYAVVISDANGCTATASAEVLQNDAITIDLQTSSYSGGYAISTYGGNDGRIRAVIGGGSAPYSMLWSTGATTGSVFGLGAGTYAVEVTDALGCTAIATITLAQPDDLVMPTGFSPNGDGANDTFFIRGLDAYPNNTFVVLNRWGNVVLDRLNYRNDWNGENSQGQALPDGTYFVILTVNNGARSLQGYVDLRR